MRLLPAVIVSALVATAIVVAVTLRAQDQREPTIHTVTFPPGSTFSIDPSVFDGIPHRTAGSVVWLELDLGDTLVVRNEDAFNHRLWAINVRPGESVGYTFAERGTFSGECTFDLTVFIEVR